MFDYLITGILNIVTDPMNITMLLIAIVIGYIGGAIPGVSGTMLVVIMLPVTYALEPTAAFILLTGIYAITAFSGAISAILLRTPGTPEAVVTTFDGYPMAQQGNPGRALGIAIFCSVTGGVIGTLCLITITPALANVALSFSSPEYFALTVLGLTVVASLSGKELAKGLIGVLFGLMISVIGMDPLTGTLRYTFDATVLTSGIDLIPVIIGLFALSEFLKKTKDSHVVQETISNVKTKIFEIEIFKKIKGTMARSSIIGVFIGILPGVGATTASMLSYSEAVRWAKDEEKASYGKGNPKGIAASETSNNAAAMGTLVPLLSLGIPGGATAAVLLGAFILHGMQPGPMLFKTEPELMYTIFAGLLLANIAMLVVSKPFIKLFQRIVNVPYHVLGPLVVVFCVIGTYTVRNNYFDILIMILFGIIGYILEKYKFPLATIILGVVLGPLTESEFRRSIQMANGDFSIFFTRPISLILIIISVLMLFYPMINDYIKKRKLQKINISA
ncbi:tripartite tricarboxylate transporter permease [Pseudalkalibacillus salsuginis]|uniref:tripartite tricarboxylate transporter permease n=1 Tax=Pseudalkalibacillus salsuginis TaxID=2910972 RepID=UPI001F3BDDF5|nr:tripartite tricarboxylate transporter permease [Pseudalkalibacillus salsuginis]MCF6410744.1 tripartite tricarboxylate transporter permease [Pseudalkalibacillus salsuginis]